MFIKLHFINPLGHAHERVIKISRIQEVRPAKYFLNGNSEGAEVLITGDSHHKDEFQEVVESIDEIFGIIQPSDELVRS